MKAMPITHLSEVNSNTCGTSRHGILRHPALSYINRDCSLTTIVYTARMSHHPICTAIVELDSRNFSIKACFKFKD